MKEHVADYIIRNRGHVGPSLEQYIVPNCDDLNIM